MNLGEPNETAGRVAMVMFHGYTLALTGLLVWKFPACFPLVLLWGAYTQRMLRRD